MTDLFFNQLKQIGLSPDDVSHHQKCLKSIILQQKKNKFDMVGTCRIDNGSILTQSWVDQFDQDPSLSGQGGGFETASNHCSIIAFIPAAGAASRYFEELSELIAAASSDDLTRLIKELGRLKNAGSDKWPLPPDLHECLKAPSISELEITDNIVEQIRQLNEFPKALMPCVLENISFMEMKCLENIALKDQVNGQIFVINPAIESKFLKVIRENMIFQNIPTKLFYQGPQLSTIRFDYDIEPIYEDDGALSLVPAGHGSLIRLITDVKKYFPDAQAIFIKNIDNIHGTKPEALRAAQRFLFTFQFIYSVLQKIRRALDNNAIKAADKLAGSILNTLPFKQSFYNDELHNAPKEQYQLWALQAWLFHSDFSHVPFTLNKLKQLYSRPLNVFGVVPNTMKDIGGTPVYVQTPKGIIKVCLELPHASDSDIQRFLKNPKLATHFNPVFVASEISDIYSHSNNDNIFWVAAKKSYKGRQVVYYETILYELLGNSETSNLVFVEIPNILFHPHKKLSEGAFKSISDWT